jgi:hypothetical protein
MNPIQLLLAIWQMIVRIIPRPSKSTSSVPVSPPESKSINPCERRVRNAAQLERRALRQRRMHGRQTRQGPRARHRRLAPATRCDAARNRAMSRRMRAERRGTCPQKVDLESILQAGLAKRTLEIKRNRRRGVWEAFSPGERRPLLHRDSREAAIEAANEHLRKRGVGQIVILGRTGEVVQTKLVWPAELAQPAVLAQRGEQR